MIKKILCFLGFHNTKLGPYAHSDHFVDTSICVNCGAKFGFGWYLNDKKPTS